jgi:hypothetical protein
MAVGGAAAALVACLAQLSDSEIGPIPFGVVLITTIAGLALVGWLLQPPQVHLTLEIDRLLGLDERVTTALELAKGHRDDGHRVRRLGLIGDRQSPRSSGSPDEPSPLADQQIADAAESLRSSAASSLYPLSASRRALVLAALGLILAGLPWLVPWPALLRTYLPPSPVALTAQVEASRLESAARRLQSDPSPLDRATRAAVAAQLQKAAAALRQSGANSSATTKALQNADQAMLAASPQSSQDASQTLARIADALNNNGLTQPVTQALDAQDSSKAASAMAQVAASLGSLSAQQRGDLANTLQSASNAARSSDTAAADQLQQAANAARDGNASGMQQATQALQQLSATSSAQNDVAQGRSELQASQEALASASQNGQPSGASSSTSPDRANSGQSSSSDPNGAASPNASPNGTSSGSPDQMSQGNSSAQSGSGTGSGDPGSGSGKGTSARPSTSGDAQGLAQRQVVVPSNGPIDQGAVSLSNQTEASSPGSAQVDYTNVLPQYRSQALQNISGNEVPSGLKQVVKGYFDSLATK